MNVFYCIPALIFFLFSPSFPAGSLSSPPAADATTAPAPVPAPDTPAAKPRETVVSRPTKPLPPEDPFIKKGRLINEIRVLVQAGDYKMTQVKADSLMAIKEMQFTDRAKAEKVVMGYASFLALDKRYLTLEGRLGFLRPYFAIFTEDNETHDLARYLQSALSARLDSVKAALSGPAFSDLNEEQRLYLETFLHHLAGSKAKMLALARLFLAKYPFSPLAYLIQDLMPEPALPHPWGYELACVAGGQGYVSGGVVQRDLSFFSAAIQAGGWFWNLGAEASLGLMLNRQLDGPLSTPTITWRRGHRLTGSVADLRLLYRWEFFSHHSLKPKIGVGLENMRHTVFTTSIPIIHSYNAPALDLGLEYQYHPGTARFTQKTYILQAGLRYHWLQEYYGIPLDGKVYYIMIGLGGLRQPAKAEI